MARLPQSRTKWWIQREFKVLPTDPRFKALTVEQISLMQEQYVIDHPEAAKAEPDPEYEEAERALEAEDRAAKAKAEPELAPVELELAEV